MSDEHKNSLPETESKPSSEKLPAAVELGKRGGLVGGPARARKLSAHERTAIARKAALERWRNAVNRKRKG